MNNLYRWRIKELAGVFPGYAPSDGDAVLIDKLVTGSSTNLLKPIAAGLCRLYSLCQALSPKLHCGNNLRQLTTRGQMKNWRKV
jgi:hypothetical protein